MPSSRHLVQLLPTETRVFPGVASGTGAAPNPSTLPVSPAAVAATTTIPTPVFSTVFPATIAAVTTISATALGETIIPAEVIAATATLPDPVVGTLLVATAILAVTSLATPAVVSDPGPGTIGASVSIVTPAIHVSVSGIVPTTPRWILRDPETGQTYEFDINPSSADYRAFQKQITYQHTLPGKSIIYEVQQIDSTLSWSGTLLLQGQLATFQSWFDNDSVVQVTDDLGRVFSIWIMEFTPKRLRNAEFPWLHTYDMKSLVLT